jgi:hypothetical protein
MRRELHRVGGDRSGRRRCLDGARSACLLLVSRRRADAKVPDWFSFRINSSLLIQHECRSPSNRQTFDTTNYFAWKHGHPELLGTEPLRY